MAKVAPIKADDVFLRHVEKGTIYGWTKAMARSKNVEEVSGKEAFPELFAPRSIKSKKVKSIDLGDLGDDAPPAQHESDKTLGREASRGLKVG